MENDNRKRGGKGNLACEVGYSGKITAVFFPTFPPFLHRSLMTKGFLPSCFLLEFNVSMEIKDVCFPLA